MDRLKNTTNRTKRRAAKKSDSNYSLNTNWVEIAGCLSRNPSALGPNNIPPEIVKSVVKGLDKVLEILT